MDFIDQIKRFAERIAEIKDGIETEEATKTSMIMPFFSQILGYDVFNPDEFIPEFTADFGAKKGERVDYAIQIGGNLQILVEAKPCGAVLDKHGAQLFRYFNSTAAKFGILTNGIVYRFFTDLEQDNLMDDTPFFQFNFEDYTEKDVTELKRFRREQFDPNKIASTASELKYINLIKDLLERNSNSPDENFVRYVMGEVYGGQKKQKAIQRFSALIETAFDEYLNDVVSEKLNNALLSTKKDSERDISEEEVEVEVSEKKRGQIVTTEEEMEAFYSVRTICGAVVPRDDITYKDTVDYFNVLFKGNRRKRICRFRFRKNGTIIFCLPCADKKEERHDLQNLDEIYSFKQNLIDIVEEYAKQ